MNLKTTVVSILLIASLYGQASKANEVTISSARFQTFNTEHINFLAESGLLRFENNQVILNLAKFDDLTRSYEQENQVAKAASLRALTIPYGCT